MYTECETSNEVCVKDAICYTIPDGEDESKTVCECKEGLYGDGMLSGSGCTSISFAFQILQINSWSQTNAFH